MSIEVVILAAGRGKRMNSALPKVLHPLAGRPLLEHVVDAARSLAPRRIHVVYGHGGDRVRAAFAAQDLNWVEQTEQLGTGHALMQALPALDSSGELLVLNGDVPLVSRETLAALAKSGCAGLAIVTCDLIDATGYGRVLRGAGGRVQGIVEHKDATPEQLAIREWYAGALAGDTSHMRSWLAKLDNHNAQGEYYLTDAIGIASRAGVDIATVKAIDPWEVAGVNSKSELALVEREVQRRAAVRLLEAGVTLADPARIDVRGTLECARDVTIDVNCVFEGNVRLGERVRIGANCVLRNVAIGVDSEVLAFSLLDDAEVGARCRIGPYARLRPGASLAEDVHIGNFVEVKASRIGAGSKANHLSYVGDAQVGEHVNIGAGTITCNYDGAAKHRTVIEDGCFIGSDATLVAPLRLAKGSYIGAGSTISKDTPPGQLTVARARQVSLPGWKPRAKKA